MKTPMQLIDMALMNANQAQFAKDKISSWNVTRLEQEWEFEEDEF